MYLKLTRARGRTYAQLVESFRDEHGQPRQRTVANVGRVDETGGQVDALLKSLLRAKGLKSDDAAAPQVRFETALSLGDVWVLDQLWRELGFDSLAAIFSRARYTTAVEQALRVMVFNRLCDADSKLGVLRWLKTVSVPGFKGPITHQHLLRSMDALIEHQQAVDDRVAALLRPLIDEDLSVVFYDLTTIRTEGASEPAGDVRRFGMAKSGLIEQQVLLGVVQTADGMPIHHEVFAGNVAEAPTLKPTVQKILARYPHIKRLIVVADRGLLSLDNLAELSALQLPGQRPLEFILAVPGRRYGEFDGILGALDAQLANAQAETVVQARWQGLRLVVAHDPQGAAEQTALRSARIKDLADRGAALAEKIEAQEAGKVGRGRKLSDSGAKARFFHEVCESHLSRIIKVDLQSDLFAFEVDLDAQRRAEAMDGKLLLVTNVEDLEPTEIVNRYKALADIERGFRVLKSDIEIAPVFHWLPDRIRAHAALCFIALILHRVMRQRLKLANSDLSPQAALATVRPIQSHRVLIDDQPPITGISAINAAQAAVFTALRIDKPSKDRQLSLL